MPNLPTLNDTEYWARVRQWALDYGSDGCTMALDKRLPACWEHDYHCVYHHTMAGEPLSSLEAVERFRQVLQWLSPMGKLSLMAQWRYYAVRYFGPQWAKPEV